MFNFMKKGVSVGSGTTGSSEKAEKDEKDKRKRDKKLRKETKNFLGHTGSMSTEELLRLDEVRRSLKIRRRKDKEKLPSGITADYSAEFFAALKESSSGSTEKSSEKGYEQDRGNEEIVASITTLIESSHSNGDNDAAQSKFYVDYKDNIPSTPPKPPKRGILKCGRSSTANAHEEIIVSSPESQILLMHNTVKNELNFDSQKCNSVQCGNLYQHNNSFTSAESVVNEQNLIRKAMTLPTVSRYNGAAMHESLNIMASPSVSAESLTDTTNSSFATPPFSLSPIGESQGMDRWSRVHSFEDMSLPLPPINFVELPPPRDITIYRQKSPRNDFGFSLRKAICLDRSTSLKTPVFRPVIFAEPGAKSTGLLPGDRLLKVNGIQVSDLASDAIIEMIRKSGDAVRVEVQPVPELVELSRRCIAVKKNIKEDLDESYENNNCNTLKRTASKRFKQQIGMKEVIATTTQLEPTKGTENVWLVHRGGFCAALRLPQSIEEVENHKVRIQLVHNNEQITVDEEDIEKQNPASLDLIEDICNLKYLNEASVLHCLRQRFASNLIHTKAGPTLLIVNPMAPLALHSEKVVSMFRGCKTEDMPPHIYAMSQTAYRAMLETRRDQSLIFLGRSGAGKTTAFKHALNYLAIAAGSCNNFFNAEKVNAISTVLEAFGNTKTCLNSNATRFTQLISLDFDQTGQIASASVQVLLLERQRSGRRSLHCNSFNIMARLITGATGTLKKDLQLDNVSFADNHPFISMPLKLEERHRLAAEFIHTCHAFDILNIDSKAVNGIWSILASIYHLGVAGVTIIGSGSTRSQFTNATAARKAASLLGVSLEELTNSAFNTNIINGSTNLKTSNDSLELAWDGLEALVIGLYSEAVGAVVALVNKCICTSANTISSIMLLDTPGFQNPASSGKQIGATIADLRHNYLQERLQLLYHHAAIVSPINRYAQELVEIDFEESIDLHPGALVALIDKTPQNQTLRSSQRDLRDSDKRGLLWLLDEETMYPNSNDETFLERLFSYYGDREHQMLLRKCPIPKHFILQHLQGTNPVLYSVEGWIRNSREPPGVRQATTLLQDSAREEINRLYIGSLSRTAGGIVFCGSFAGLEGTQSLRRVSSIRRSFTSAGVKKNSIMLQMKYTVDGIIDTLRRTGTHFVHCYLLQHSGGLQQGNSDNGSPNANTQPDTSDSINIPLLRSQLRGSQVIEAARLFRLGFPESVPLLEFTRRFGLLSSNEFEADTNVTPEQILLTNEIDAANYRIGSTQVLFRYGVLGVLEAKREELLSERIIRFQAACRGFLARKALGQKRVQELAVRCIQRNVKAFLTVRDWPWWRLLVRVTPLLNVHRTEEQLKTANEELHVLRSKLEKLENERNSLKTENQKLEAKLSEMTVDLAEERSSANIISERLDVETSERLKLERELNDQQKKVKTLQESTEKLEMELICAKSDLNGVSEDEDLESDEGHGGVYKQKYERVARELEFTKRRLQTQHEHDLEQLIGLKKQLEKKLSDAYEEVTEQRQIVNQWKRKAQKMTNEMNDLRMLLEEQNARNNLLEKKQRKFDSESSTLQDLMRQERQAKERLSREKDILMAEKFALEQTLSDTRLDLDLKDEKLSSLQRELEEISFGGGTEEEMAQLRRSKNDLDRRVKEQEEELDEMAGQVQLLEQSKLRLEMSLETMRKEARREAQQRDEELEETRGSAFKKIKALECQLETEHEERTLLLREKHELERRLVSLEDKDRVDRQVEEISNQKLKRDIRKYKALLKDAQTQLDRLKAETPGKALIRQLRNQLEDAESSRTLAMKARQTAENELVELQTLFEETNKARNEAEERANVAHRDRAELQAQIEENEEELAELMKKYSSSVKQLNAEQIAVSECEIKLSELEEERNNLKEQLSDLQQRLENAECLTDSTASIVSKRLELRNKEVESRLELEQATRSRLEVQVNRHKESLEKVQNELSLAKARELQALENMKKSQKALREMKDEFHSICTREQESIIKRKDLEKKLEQMESETCALRNDLRLALQRISDLQHAMEEEADDLSESEASLSTDGSLSEIEDRFASTSKNRFLNIKAIIPNATLTLVDQRDESTPRVTLTSTSTSQVPTIDTNNETSMVEFADKRTMTNEALENLSKHDRPST